MSWWEGRPDEIYWMEITDRADLGVDLKAPQTYDNGRPYWSYTLVTQVQPGDVVLHYYKPDKAVVALSVAAGLPWEEDIVWASHGTVARAAGVEPYRRPGFRLALEHFTYLRDPIDLEQFRAGEAQLRAAAAEVEALGRGRSYFPFALSEKRPVRPQQGYLVKVPRRLIDLFPDLGQAVGEVMGDLSGRATPSGVIDVGDDYRWANETAASSERDPFAVDPALVERGIRGHARTQNALATWLRARGIEPRSPKPAEPYFDLAWRQGGTTYVAEVKSVTSANEEKQLRLGLGQVLRYRHLLHRDESGTTEAVLVAEREPSDPSWVDLADAVGVTLVWPGAFERLRAS